MKSRLNITINEALLNKAKKYASKKRTSLSALIEEYFKRITVKRKEKNIVELVESLPKPKYKYPEDLKKAYYEEKMKKYGS